MDARLRRSLWTPIRALGFKVSGRRARRHNAVSVDVVNIQSLNAQDASDMRIPTVSVASI